MTTIDQKRADFEQKHQVPIGIFWNDIDQKYAATGEPFWHVTLDVYNAMWQGYQSALEDRQGEAVARMVHDFPHLKDFYVKHAMGSMLKPSCFKCGSNENKPSIQHMELPNIYICDKCTSPQPAQPDQWNAVTEAIDNIKLCFVDLVADKVALAAMVPLGRLVALEKAILALRKGA